MAKRSVDFGTDRFDLLVRIASEYEITFEELVLRFVDAGMAALPPRLPQHLSHLLLSATPPAPPPQAAPLQSAGEDGVPAAPALAMSKAEIEWRIEDCISAHLRGYLRFRQRIDGVEKPSMPSITANVRTFIRDALHRHDAHLLGPDARDQWRKESRVRAAGIGIFSSPWHTGENESKQRYLEPWRPWKIHAGKDPVDGFASTYFELKEAAAAAKGEGQ